MNLNLNAKRFSGNDYIKIYDQFRPMPPIEMLRQAIRYSGEKCPYMVVDIGCGTGISTITWSPFVEQVIGIEPSTEMLIYAQSKLNNSIRNVDFLSAFSNQLPIADESVNIVTCSQAFHWMEPSSTLKEIHRVLKKGGVFLVYDTAWPPSYHYELEQAYHTLFQRVNDITASLKQQIAIYFPKEKHLENIKKSQYFDFVKTAQYHKIERGGKNKFLGIALSQGGLEALLKRAYTEEQVGLSHFKTTIDAFDDTFSKELCFHYNAIFAVK